MSLKTAYRIDFSKCVEGQLKKIPKELVALILRRISGLKENPRPADSNTICKK